jgi:hypothetical protein
VVADPHEDVGEYLPRVATRGPVRPRAQRAAVRQVDPHVAGARPRVGSERDVVARELAAQLRGLAQRQAALRAAADVDDRARPVLGAGELLVDEIDEIEHVQDVADLLALAAEAQVGQLAAEVERGHPVGEDPLVDLAHLPRPCDDAAAVDHRAQPEGLGVLGDQELCRELRRAVQRAGAVEREALGDPVRGGPGHRLLGGQLEARLALRVGQAVQPGDRVDAARRQEDELGAVAGRLLQAVVGAHQVRVHDEAGGAVGAGHHRRLGGALDERVERPRGPQVVRLAHVPVDEAHAGLAQAGHVELRASAVQAVERDELPARMPGEQLEGQVGPDEPGAAGDEDAGHRLGVGSRAPMRRVTLPRGARADRAGWRDRRCRGRGGAR